MIGTWFKCALVCFLLYATATAQNPTSNSGGKAQASIDRICLSQMLIAAPGSGTTEIAAARGRAQQVRDVVRSGGSWADLARTDSQGPSALQVSGLGCLQRGQLARPIGEMKVGDVSDVLSTKLGFVILQVTGDEPPTGLETQKPVLDSHESGVRGRVVGTVDLIPIRNAYIVVHRDGAADAHVRADATGRYAVPLPVGIYDVFIAADGFSPTSRKIEVSPNGMMIYDAVLEFNTLGMQFDAKTP